MGKKINRYVAALSIVILAATGLAFAGKDRGRWEKAAEKKVNFDSETDEIKLKKGGPYDEIKLKAKNSGVRIRDFRIHYKNGKVRNIKGIEYIREDHETRSIEVRKDGEIKKLVLKYETRDASSQKAVIEVWVKEEK